MNLRQVEAFRAVMLTGQMTAAAELMSITQPAVSRLIRDFEHATRLKLFERRGNLITATQAAMTLWQEVDRAFIGLGRIAAAADDIARHAVGTLRIATLPFLGNSFLPRFLARFLRDKPGLHASLNSLPSFMVVEAVAAGQADIGFAEVPLDRPGLLIEARSFAAVVALPEGHALCARDVVHPADFRGERMIRVDPGTLFAMRVEVALAGVTRLSALETPLSHTALALVSEGAGIAIVDPISASEFEGRGVVIRPFGLFVEDGFLAIRRSSQGRSEIADQFCLQFLEFHDHAMKGFQALI